MFTGIVTDVGRIKRIEKRGDTHVVITTKYDVRDIDIGASIACAGICLTVTDKGIDGDPWFAVTASRETVSKTNIAKWKEGRGINLERSLRLGDELGGHIVVGHVDGPAEIISLSPEGESKRVVFGTEKDLLRFIAPKGSVALDGVSLTVNEVKNGRFGVNIIPHTLKATTFGSAKKGDRVNLEVDLLARYVARLAKR